MRRLIQIFIFLLISGSLLAQDKQGLFLDSLYSGGENTYGADLKTKLKIPRSMLGNTTFGFIIYEISVKSSGEIDYRFLTRINDDYEKSALAAIQHTLPKWKTTKSDYRIYQSILFGAGNEDKTPLIENFKGYSMSLSYPFASQTGLYAVSVTRVVSTSGGSTRSTATPSTSTPLKIEDQIRTYQGYEERMQKALDKGKTKRAYSLLNQMILLNPYNREHVVLRNKLENELGLNEYSKYDKAWLEALDYIDSLQDKI